MIWKNSWKSNRFKIKGFLIIGGPLTGCLWQFRRGEVDIFFLIEPRGNVSLLSSSGSFGPIGTFDETKRNAYSDEA